MQRKYKTIKLKTVSSIIKESTFNSFVATSATKLYFPFLEGQAIRGYNASKVLT
ncbi:hypothetical protein JCM19047_4010 [Bacillus sp. JCM 19047]|nr:hypothetical protein JCM19047_4010 [Bacillus sp. JCM 19047]